MKCPLFLLGFLMSGRDYGAGDIGCIKEECACWDKMFECCDPTGLLPLFSRLVDILSEIERRMPHEEQFRK